MTTRALLELRTDKLKLLKMIQVLTFILTKIHRPRVKVSYKESISSKFHTWTCSRMVAEIFFFMITILYVENYFDNRLVPFKMLDSDRRETQVVFD